MALDVATESPTFSADPDVVRSLYVHVPFCRHRCGYCNFTLIAGRDDLIERYLLAIEREISWVKSRHEVKTVFLGGGTPSHLDPEQLDRLFESIRKQFDFVDGIEISAECNPNDFDYATAHSFERVGINRISFGAQSFNSKKLKFLQRDHSSEDIINAVNLARNITDNISLDLIFATKGENLSSWMLDMKSAIELQPAHLSTYELTIEKGTQFWNRLSAGSLSELSEDLRADLYENTIRFCHSNGLNQYEISSFAVPGFECQHNLSYWSGDDYFAFGPGAARFVESVRETNHRSTTSYLKLVEAGRLPVVERQVLTQRESAIDRLVFGLRKTKGVCISNFESSTGFVFDSFFENSLNTLFDNRLLEIHDDHCRLTTTGILLYDGIAAQIIAKNSAE